MRPKGKVPGKDAPLTPGAHLCGTIKETYEILIMLTLMGEFPSCLQWLICGHHWRLTEASCPGTHRRKSAMDFIGGGP